MEYIADNRIHALSIKAFTRKNGPGTANSTAFKLQGCSPQRM